MTNDINILEACPVQTQNILSTLLIVPNVNVKVMEIIYKHLVYLNLIYGYALFYVVRMCLR